MKYQCLIVDDEPLAIDILAGYLENINDFHLVGKCRSAMEAYPFLHENNIDLIFLDIRMPKVDGVEVLRRIKEHKELQKIPIIMITTTDDPREVEKCHALGCSSYITKPVNYENFMAAIKHLGFFLKLVKLPIING